MIVLTHFRRIFIKTQGESISTWKNTLKQKQAGQRQCQRANYYLPSVLFVPGCIADIPSWASFKWWAWARGKVFRHFCLLCLEHCATGISQQKLGILLNNPPHTGKPASEGITHSTNANAEKSWVNLPHAWQDLCRQDDWGVNAQMDQLDCFQMWLGSIFKIGLPTSQLSCKAEMRSSHVRKNSTFWSIRRLFLDSFIETSKYFFFLLKSISLDKYFP